MKTEKLQEKSKKNKYILFCIIGHFILYAYMCLSDIEQVADIAYLQNRMEQIKYNLSHGFDISFYFNDFLGVGYGTSFYYGGLTLVPFALLGADIGFKLFLLVSRVLILYGLYRLCRLFIIDKNKANFVFFVISMSEFFITSLRYNMLIPNQMGLGISLLCLVNAIEFFRDKKKDKGYLMCLFYFLTIMTHSISAFLTAIGLIIICIWYFDKKQIKQYCLMFFIASTQIAFSVCNILYHSNTFTSERRQALNQRLVDAIKAGKVTLTLGSSFLGKIGSYIVGMEGFAPFEIVLLTFLIIILIKKKDTFKKTLTIKHKILFSCIFVLLLVGTRPIWLFLLDRFDLIIQFPCRYAYYIFPLIIIFVFREATDKIERVYSIILHIMSIIFLLLCVIIAGTPLKQYERYIVNGDYLTNDFEFNSEKFDRNRQRVLSLTDNKEIPYEYYEDGVLVEYQGDTTTLQIPKLYYRGYIAEDLAHNNEKLECKLGYSQWINIDITDNEYHKIFIHYRQPLFLIILRYVAFVSVITTLILFVRYKVCRKTIKDF